MKALFGILLLLNLVACNTVSGTLQGAGKDISAAGKWIEPKSEVPLYPEQSQEKRK
jgi:predicted small secreted protein